MKRIISLVIALLLISVCASAAAVDDEQIAVKVVRFEPLGGFIYSKEDVKSASVCIGDKDYNSVKEENGCFYFEYPEQPVDTEVTAKLFSSDGRETDIDAKISDDFSLYSVRLFDENIRANNSAAMIKGDDKLSLKMFAEIGGETYECDYKRIGKNAMDKAFAVYYPEAEPGTEIKIHFETQYGARTETETRTIYDKKLEIHVSSVNKNRLYAHLFDTEWQKISKESSEAIAVVNGVEYKGVSADDNEYLFSYKARTGDSVELKFHDSDGYSFTKELTIPEGDGVIELIKCNADSAIFSFYSSYSNIKSASLKVGAKTVKFADYSEKDYERDSVAKFPEFKSPFVFDDDNVYMKASFLTKAGKTITVKVVTDDGYTYTETAKTESFKPYLKLNEAYSSDTKISGEANKNAVINLKVGSDLYIVKPNSKGKFSQRIKTHKTGSKITAQAIIKKCSSINTVKSKIKTLKGTSEILTPITSDTENIKVSFTNARKGDMLRLKVGSKLYSKTITKSHDSASYIFRVKSAKRKTKVKLVYSDSFGTRKSSDIKTVIKR